MITYHDNAASVTKFIGWSIDVEVIRTEQELILSGGVAGCSVTYSKPDIVAGPLEGQPLGDTMCHYNDCHI